MDYREAAEQLLHSFQQFRKRGHHKKIDGTLRGERFVLLSIFRQGTSVLPGQLSAEMSISSARIARVLKSLEEKGLITRQIDQKDRRQILVNLTSEGTNAAKKHRQTAINMTVKMLRLLGEKDTQELVRITRRLAALAPDPTAEE